MKTFFTLLVLILFLGNTHAAIPVTTLPGNPNAANIFFPIGKEGKTISLLELSTISRVDLEKLTGRKMNLLEKIAFKSGQRKIKSGLNKDGEVTSKKLRRLFDDSKSSSFNSGGFFLGLFLGLIGVIITYLINDEKNKGRRKWAVIGAGIGLAIGPISFLFWLNNGTF